MGFAKSQSNPSGQWLAGGTFRCESAGAGTSRDWHVGWWLDAAASQKTMQSACLSKVCEHGLWFRFEDQTEACSAWGLWRWWINMAWLTSLKTSWRHGKVSVAPTYFDLLHHPWNLEIEHVAYHSQTCMLELGLNACSRGAFPPLLNWLGPFSASIAPMCREAFARCPSFTLTFQRLLKQRSLA